MTEDDPSFRGFSTLGGVRSEGDPWSDRDRYQRGGTLGRGGMGTVVAAHDQRLARDLAIKRADPSVPGAAHQLRREARLLAQLEHPHVVQVHDAGEDPDGTPWVALALVRGRTLADAIGAARDAYARRALIRPLLSACQAVGHAHRLGIVHRDLKPTNLMLGELGELQVTDWGLAEPLPGHGYEGLLGDAPPVLGAGTEGWSAPEQLAGAAPDPRADVYGLGAVLLTVLDGPTIPGSEELRAIGVRATATRPADRYADAAEVGQELERWLDGRRVHAYDYAAVELMARAVRAWRVPLGVAAVAAVILVGAGLASWRATARERDRALAAERGTAEALRTSDRHLAQALLATAQERLDRGAVPEAEVLAARAAALTGDPAAIGLLAAAGAWAHPARSTPGWDTLDCAWRRPVTDGVLCAQEDALLVADEDGRPRFSVPGRPYDAVRTEDGWVVTLADGLGWDARLLDPDGNVRLELRDLPSPRRLATGPAGTVLWDGQEARWLGPELEVVPTCADGSLHALVVDETGYVALCTDGTARHHPRAGPVTRVQTPLVRELPASTAATRLADGAVALGLAKGQVARLDPTTGEVAWVTQVSDGPVFQLCVSPDGSRIAAMPERVGPIVLDALDGHPIARLPLADRGPCLFEADGSLVTAGSRAARWSLGTATSRPVVALGAGLTWVAQTGGRLVATSGDGTVGVWGTDGAPVATYRWQDRVVKGGTVAPDGTVFVVDGGSPGIHRIPTDGGPLPERIETGTNHRRVGALASGWLWTGSWGHGLMLNHRETGEARRALEDLRIVEGWTRADGSAAVLLDDHEGAWLLVDGDPPTARSAGQATGATALALGPADEILIGTAHEVRLRVGDEVRASVDVPSLVNDLAVDAAGRLVAAGLLDGTTLVLSFPELRVLASLPPHRERIGGVAFDPTGRWLLTAGWEGEVHTADLRRLERTGDDREHDWGIALDQAL
ncbi:MAG: protein kinase [Alphaproteobacteria bacterium]|nr:protein kinase [Alphaproteobacteria bacterium]